MACSDVPRALPCADIWVGSSLGILKGEMQLYFICIMSNSQEYR